MIKLRDVHSLDELGSKFMYELLRIRSQEDDPYVNISHRALPSWEDHAAFVLSKPYYLWFLIQAKDVTKPGIPWAWVGSLSVTDRNEIGIMLSPHYRRRGIAREAIQHLLNIYPPLPAKPSHRPGTFVANINPANLASIKLFTGLGAVHIQNTYQFQEREHGKRNTE